MTFGIEVGHGVSQTAYHRPDHPLTFGVRALGRCSVAERTNHLEAHNFDVGNSVPLRSRRISGVV